MPNKDFYDRWYADRIGADLQIERIISKHLKEGSMKPKDYYYHFTGEVRPPKKGEFYVRGDIGYPYRADMDMTEDGFIRYIYTRHEIEVPEGSYFAEIGFTGYSNTVCIPLSPRPKPKVKKWKWVLGGKEYVPHITTGWYTEEEIKKQYPSAEWYHKIDETEVKE
jgi:(2Fe-2S) ferredoxin